MAGAYEIRTAIVNIPDMERFLKKLRMVMQARKVTIVCFNARNMAGMHHAEAALSHALRSFSHGDPIAKTLEMEALLYAAGTRQCSEAIELGVNIGENRAYVCCCPPCPEAWRDLEPLMQFVDYDEGGLDPGQISRLLRIFSITDAELAAAGGMERLQDLVVERVALLDAYR